MSMTLNLQTQIRLALASLGRDPKVRLSRSTTVLKDQLRALRAEQIERGGILKPTFERRVRGDRVRRARALLQKAIAGRDAIEARLNDPANPQPPTGDDYNDLEPLFAFVSDALQTLED